MKKTFTAKTFASKTFACGAWAGVGSDVEIIYPPGRLIRGIAEANGVRRGRVYVAGLLRGDGEAVGVIRGRTN